MILHEFYCTVSVLAQSCIDILVIEDINEMRNMYVVYITNLYNNKVYIVI